MSVPTSLTASNSPLNFRLFKSHVPGLFRFGKVCHNRTKEIAVATMNVSLPDPMKEWVEAQARTGRYSNASDYVRDLIRRDQERGDRICRMQKLLTEGLESGVSSETMDDIAAAARASESGHAL
jgi:antitoxin ParD1/3/4